MLRAGVKHLQLPAICHRGPELSCQWLHTWCLHPPSAAHLLTRMVSGPNPTPLAPCPTPGSARGVTHFCTPPPVAWQLLRDPRPCSYCPTANTRAGDLQGSCGMGAGWQWGGGSTGNTLPLLDQALPTLSFPSRTTEPL